jgi:hypothetical protein
MTVIDDNRRRVSSDVVNVYTTLSIQMLKKKKKKGTSREYKYIYIFFKR